MESTGNISMVDKRDELVIRAALEVAIALAQVDVDFDGMLDRRHREDARSIPRSLRPSTQPLIWLGGMTAPRAPVLSTPLSSHS